LKTNAAKKNNRKFRLNWNWNAGDTLQLPNYTSYWDTISGYLRRNAHQLFM